MPSLAIENNNPGNLIASPWTQKQPGYVGVGRTGKFAVFQTRGHGMAALVRLLDLPSYRKLTVPEMLARYAPKTENDTLAYNAFVLSKSGVPAMIPLEKLTNGDCLRVIAAMCDMED